MTVSNSSLFAFHQAQVGSQHHPYGDPDFPLSHNVLRAVLQSTHCIIMSFWKMVMWIVSKQELKDREIYHCLQLVQSPPRWEPFAPSSCAELLLQWGGWPLMFKRLSCSTTVCMHKLRHCIGTFSQLSEHLGFSTIFGMGKLELRHEMWSTRGTHTRTTLALETTLSDNQKKKNVLNKLFS